MPDYNQLYNVVVGPLDRFISHESEAFVKRWTGREIYLTQERWDHILSKHEELSGRLDEVLKTIRLGRRKQTKRDPRTFIYYRQVQNLPEPYDTILVFVAFRYNYIRYKYKLIVNNFVTKAWGDVSTS